MTTARRYTMEQIEAARKKLRSLPMKTIGKTRAEVAEFLGKDIRKAVRQGYSLHDIRDLLADAGVSVPLARLKALFEKVPALGSATGKEERDHSPARCRWRNWRTWKHRRDMRQKETARSRVMPRSRRIMESLERGGGRVSCLLERFAVENGNRSGGSESGRPRRMRPKTTLFRCLSRLRGNDDSAAFEIGKFQKQNAHEG